MNARSYRVNLILSPLDFPTIIGLGQSSVSFQSEPHIDKKNVVLTITTKCVVTDIYTNKQYEVFTAKSDYEIPANNIRNREIVYEFYKDATLSLNEAYQGYKTQLPSLLSIIFPTQPIENYKGEIDRVFNLLNSRN